MTIDDNSKRCDDQSAIRSSRYLSLSRTIALGASITIGIGVFILLGLVLDISGTRAPLSYALLALITIPVVLAFAERAIAYPSGNGVFWLGREGDPAWYTYAGNWIALGGFGSVFALFGWGTAYYINLLLERLFLFTVDTKYLGIGIIILVALIRSISTRGSWRTRVRIVYLSLPVLVLLVAWGWFSAGSTINVNFALRTPGNALEAVAYLAAVLWGLGLILDQRCRMRHSSRKLVPALYVSLLLVAFTGMVGVLTVLDSPGLKPGDPAPLVYIAGEAGTLAELIYLLAGVTICLVAMDRTIASGLRLIDGMKQEGNFPSHLQLFSGKVQMNLSRLNLIVLLSILILFFLPLLSIAAITSLSILVITIVVFGSDLMRPRMHLPKKRTLKLPFYPLFSGLAVAVSLYLSFSLSFEFWLILLTWLILGTIYYFAYARKRSIAIRREASVLVEEKITRAKKAFQILIDVTEAEDLESLIQAGLQLAKAGDGQILVLQTIIQPAYISTAMEKRIAGQALSSLKSKIKKNKDDAAVPIETMVRLSSSRSLSILETVREEKIDLVLLGWASIQGQTEGVLNEELNRVVLSAPCDVAILHGKITNPIHSVTVSTRGGPHAGEALKYGQWLTGDEETKVVALTIVSGQLTPEKEESAQSRLQQAIADTGDPDAFIPRISQANDVKDGILQESSGSDLLLLGASTKGLLDEAIFDGIPVEVANARKGPTLLVKHYEGGRQFWLRRMWGYLYAPFPTLTVGERVSASRRIRESAVANVDFYAMIILASIIAILGLIQNSAAIIIGAMLVAPLMSPILAIAFSLVLGDVRLLAQSGESTIKGVLMAVAVSVVIAIILPPLPITSEVLARTQPNLLDLMVALASGAAAAYAMARKQLAAALPGVAIAAALVPPLCVVGYGLGFGLYYIAGGALLLFITNLSAIILSGAIVFLLLGFRPTRAEYGQQNQRWFLLSIAILVIIATPLALTSINLRESLDRKQKVENVLTHEFDNAQVDIEDVKIVQKGDGFIVSGTIYAYGTLSNDDLSKIQELLSEEIGAPVIIRARIIQSKLEIIGSDSRLKSETEP